MQLVTNDNLDLGCAVIEQAATDKVSLIKCVFLWLVLLVTKKYFCSLFVNITVDYRGICTMIYTIIVGNDESVIHISIFQKLTQPWH